MNFYEKYFLINLKDYSNIGLDLEINKILFCILVGAVLAIAIIGYRKVGICRVLKSLLRHESRDEESAKTLDELKINSLCVRIALSATEGRLAKIISRVGATSYTYEQYIASIKKNKSKPSDGETGGAVKDAQIIDDKIDFSTARFFISADKTEEAKSVYDRSDSPTLHTVLTCVLLVSLYICLLFAMPGILELVNSFLAK